VPLPKGELALSTRRTAAVVTWIDAFGAVQRRAAGSSLLSERLYLAGRSRVKKWKRQNEPSHQGYYWFAQLERHVWYETITEYLGLMYLDQSRTVRAISAQPMLIGFGNGHAHYPDYLYLGDHTQQTIFDVHRADKVEEDPSQFEATFDLCQRIGWSFELFTGLDPVRQANLEWLAAFRHKEYAPSGEEARQLLKAVEHGVTVGDLRQQFWEERRRVMVHLYHLLWTRKIGFDDHEPLSERTVIWGQR
jgi:hypothetical protein